MDEELTKILLEDLYTASEKVLEIKLGLRENLWIKNQSYYLNPIVDENVTMPLDNERGEFEYYKRIETDIRKLLKGERVKYTYHFNGAPKEIKQLFR